MIKRVINTVIPIVVLLLLSMTLQSFTVVIDAGHGGHDAGAIGLKMGVKEKDLNLAVAQRLADNIRAKYPEVKEFGLAVVVAAAEKRRAATLAEVA